jgi:hypothetical protein
MSSWLRRRGTGSTRRSAGAEGLADLLRSTSMYRGLDGDVRERLLDAIAERIRTRMGDQASRRYQSVVRVGQRAD